FIQEYGKEISLDDNIEKHETTVLYSHSQKKYFSIVNGLSYGDCERFFKETGTTICIANMKSMVRCMSFDIDCICRKDPTTKKHLDSSIISTIVETLTSSISSQVKNLSLLMMHSGKC